MAGEVSAVVDLYVGVDGAIFEVYEVASVDVRVLVQHLSHFGYFFGDVHAQFLLQGFAAP